ncbi:hypothetical protein [Aminipila sp.]|uniref:hypothetical protein n=1 Tax=Aminipila sp. TaxID=2060095 RepID=UPI00289CE6FA|nr:hypothetical protein [Aminipila sp.]
MLIIKGGISREINKNNLQSYLDKGYKAVEEPEEPEEKAEKKEKPKNQKKG